MSNKRDLITKDFAVKFTITDATDERGVFTGYASVFNVVDSYGDMVVPGAFKKTLKENNPIPMLWNHNVDQPIGVIELAEDANGLHATGHLNLDVERAGEIRSLMKQGAVKGLSIGYQTVREMIDKITNARILKEIKLWEVSPVVFPANPAATVATVKSADGTDDCDHDSISESVESPKGKCDHCGAMIDTDKIDDVNGVPGHTTPPDDKSDTPGMIHLLEKLKFERKDIAS